MNSIFRFAAAPLIGVVVVLGLCVGSLAVQRTKRLKILPQWKMSKNLTFNDVTLNRRMSRGALFGK